jgi:hypothetical protein
MDASYIHTFFAIMRLFFHKVSVIYIRHLPVLSKVALYQCCKIPYLDFGPHRKRYKETLNEVPQQFHRVRPNRNTEDVLLLHDNARPHTSLLTRESNTKMGWTVLRHPAHSPDLATSD